MKYPWLSSSTVNSALSVRQAPPVYFAIPIIDDDWSYDVDVIHIEGDRFWISRIDRPDLAGEMEHLACELLPYVRAGYCFQVGKKQGRGYILMTHPERKARQEQALAGLREVRSAIFSARYGPDKESDPTIVERLERIAHYLTNRYVRLITR